MAKLDKKKEHKNGKKIRLNLKAWALTPPLGSWAGQTASPENIPARTECPGEDTVGWPVEKSHGSSEIFPSALSGLD